MGVKFYEDKTCTRELKSLDFGIVEVGDIKEISFYILNDGIYSIHEFKLIIDSKEKLQTSVIPSVLQPNKPVKITITWSPSLKRKEPLKTEINAQGYYIVK